jgi:hypothetical protein
MKVVVMSENGISAQVTSQKELRTVSGKTTTITGTVTRPTPDATLYTAGDALTDSASAPTVITFANCGRYVGGTGFIIGALLVDSANQTTKLSCELWVFESSPTPDNDNAVFTPTDAECATLVGIIPFNTSYVGDATAGAGGNIVFPAAGISPLPFVCAAASTNLFGLVVVRNGYTPVAAEVLTFKLRLLQD